MKHDTGSERLRWLEQAEADREGAQLLSSGESHIPTRYLNGLPDSIAARVYTRAAAGETLRMADRVLDFASGCGVSRWFWRRNCDQLRLSARARRMGRGDLRESTRRA